MGFDKTKDWCIWSRLIKKGIVDYVISIHKYDNGEPKIQFSKIQYNEYGHKFSKFGRIDEVVALEMSSLLEVAVEFIKNWDGERVDLEFDFKGDDK